jgi:DNA-binding MarR family transcriptional regulator
MARRRLRLIPGVHRATHHLARRIAMLRDPEVTPGEAHILAALAGSGSATVAELHQALAHRRSTLTSILDRLESRGLVTRRISETDRRSVVITATRNGLVAARKIHRELRRIESQVLAAVDARDADAFERVIAALESALEPAGESESHG